MQFVDPQAPCALVVIDRNSPEDVSVTPYLTFVDAVHAAADKICQEEGEDDDGCLAVFEQATNPERTLGWHTLNRAFIADTLMNWRPDDLYDVACLVSDYYSWPFLVLFYEIGGFKGAGTQY